MSWLSPNTTKQIQIAKHCHLDQRFPGRALAFHQGHVEGGGDDQTVRDEHLEVVEMGEVVDAQVRGEDGLQGAQEDKEAGKVQGQGGHVEQDNQARAMRCAAPNNWNSPPLKVLVKNSEILICLHNH